LFTTYKESCNKPSYMQVFMFQLL